MNYIKRMIFLYIIIANGERWSWISGIFEQEQSATDYCESMPTDLAEIQTINQIQASYPFFIIETNNKFEYLNQEELITKLNKIEAVNNPDHLYFNIYTVNSDFRSERPGTDAMGLLQHDHIDNSFMEWYRKEGEAFLKRRRIIPGYAEED